VRVAEPVGEGKVKVSLSFAEWKDGKVAPARFEIPVFDPQAKAKKD
jgi:hypothetical protein